MPGDMGGYVIISDAEIHSASYSNPSLHPKISCNDREAHPLTVIKLHVFKMMLEGVSKNIFSTPLKR